MKKDGIVEGIRSSRLTFIHSETPVHTSQSGSPRNNTEKQTNLTSTNKNSEGQTVACSESEGSRVIAEARSANGLRGVPKSGRVWKRIKSQRFSTIRNDKQDTTTWRDKVEKKSDKAASKSFAKELKEGKLEREKAERDRVVAKRKRKLENEKKNEIVVPLKNTAKIKRMRKKQLRSVEKR